MVKAIYTTQDGTFRDVRVTSAFNAETVRQMLERQFRQPVLMVTTPRRGRKLP